MDTPRAAYRSSATDLRKGACRRTVLDPPHTRTGTVESCDAHWKGIVAKLEGTAAHTNDQIYDIGRQADPNGGTGYFEATVMPEMLLQDMIKATKAGESEHEFVYLRKMISEGVGNQIKWAPRDPSAFARAALAARASAPILLPTPP